MGKHTEIVNQYGRHIVDDALRTAIIAAVDHDRTSLEIGPHRVGIAEVRTDEERRVIHVEVEVER